MENEILLPVDQIDLPKKSDWTKLPDSFCEAVEVVRQCVGKDEGSFSMTCVHIHPKHIEASDNYQVTRYKIKTGFSKSVLVRHETMLHVGSLAVTEFAECDSWIHFRGASDGDKGRLVVSCRKYEEEFPNLDSILKMEGIKVTLPKRIVEAAATASVFSSENLEGNLVSITIKPGKLILRGEGANGWYTESKSLKKYKGPKMKFMIQPALLKDIMARGHECEVSPERLKIDCWTYVYLTCLDSSDE